MRLPPELPTTDVAWQVAWSGSGVFYPPKRPASDREWQSAMRTMGLSDLVTVSRPLTDEEWQSGVVRPLAAI